MAVAANEARKQLKRQHRQPVTEIELEITADTAPGSDPAREKAAAGA